MFCKVTRLESPPITGSDWGASPWKDIPSESIRNIMGAKPAHFPKTAVKIAYDAAAIFVMFRVEDRYVCAVAAANQDSVCRDSCVEFFFTPGADVSKGYFNLEMNCGGTMLFHFQTARGMGQIVIPKRELDEIESAHSMPRIVEPEISAPVTWTVSYRLPIALLERYCPVSPPAPGEVWRANFYKCGDNTSHPHWLTWSPVNLPKPDFHVPQSFGLLEFQ